METRRTQLSQTAGFIVTALVLLVATAQAIHAAPTIGSVAISYAGNGTLTILGSELGNASSVTLAGTALTVQAGGSGLRPFLRQFRILTPTVHYK